jgi:hypothetical protein
MKKEEERKRIPRIVGDALSMVYVYFRQRLDKARPFLSRLRPQFLLAVSAPESQSLSTNL